MRAHTSLTLLVSCSAALALAVVSGCGSSGGECSDLRQMPKVFYGTELPTYIPIDTGQLVAVGNFGVCSGTLIAPRWVLTAKHCILLAGVEFCMRESPGQAETCIQTVRVVDHPDLDLTLLELDEDAMDRIPGAVPIPIMTEDMDEAWVGHIAEAAGYGQTETGGSGELLFTAEPIAELSSEFVIVDGQGQRGLCFGDSGGPVMVLASDGTVRVAGALSFGDSSCVGRDQFTRIDRERAWVESFTGPTEAGAPSCGLTIDATGRCAAASAVWCEGGDELRIESCAAGTACGWDEADQGFRCIAGPDPCEGFDSRGGCDGDVARWCDNGAPISIDCAGCGEFCHPNATPAGADCMFDSCMGLDFLGQCDGDVARWCDDGEVRSTDCSIRDESCGFIDDDIGFYCM